MMRYAVRYQDHGDDTERYIFAASPHEQAIHLRHLLQYEGVAGEAVEFTVIKDISLAWRVAREFVEDTVRELVDGERGLDEVNAMLRPLSPDLHEEDEVAALLKQNPHIGGCVRTTRIEELADLMDRAAKTGGLVDVGDRDIDKEDRQREWLIRVLAGQEDHSGMDAPCHRCTTVVRSTVRDLDADTTTETKRDAA